MKATELMRALDAARPEALEAAAPSPRKRDRKPDISGVLESIRAERGVSASGIAVTQKSPRQKVMPALLTACSIAACAAVVTGFALLIRDSQEPLEQSSDAAVQLPTETTCFGEESQATAEAEQAAVVTAVSDDSKPLVVMTFISSQPGWQNVSTKTTFSTSTDHESQQTTKNLNPVQLADNKSTEGPPLRTNTAARTTTGTTAKTTPRTTAPVPPNAAYVRVEYKVPENISGDFTIDFYDYASSDLIASSGTIRAEKCAGVISTVEIPQQNLETNRLIAVLYDANGKKAEIGTFAVQYSYNIDDKPQNSIKPITMNVGDAFRALTAEKPAETTAVIPQPVERPAFNVIEHEETLPATSFIYQWNSDQYRDLDTCLYFESAALWKERRMSGGDWALYAEHNDGFRYLDEHADSGCTYYLWFMYEADGFVPEVRRIEGSDQSGYGIFAALVPADVHGKVRVMIPLGENTTLPWMNDCGMLDASSWRLFTEHDDAPAGKPIEAHWYLRIDETSSVQPFN